jgi:competence protein ComEA
MRKFLQAYLNHSPTELRGILILSFLLIVLELSRAYYLHYKASSEPWQVKVGSPEEKWIADKMAQGNDRSNTKVEFMNKDAEPFFFDPNTLDQDGWIALGFSPKQALAILKSRDKGFKFYRKEDVKKLFCVTDVKYNELEPYITIPTEKSAKENTPKQNRSIKPLEVNSTDSLTLLGVPGIGPWRAGKIIRRRNALGGFYNLSQIAEIKGFTDSLLQTWRGKLFVDSLLIKKIKINSVSLEEIQKHPYCWYGVGKSIVNYRSKNGPFHSVADLYKLYALSPEQIRKLAPYLSFE